MKYCFFQDFIKIYILASRPVSVCTGLARPWGLCQCVRPAYLAELRNFTSYHGINMTCNEYHLPMPYVENQQQQHELFRMDYLNVSKHGLQHLSRGTSCFSKHSFMSLISAYSTHQLLRLLLIATGIGGRGGGYNPIYNSVVNKKYSDMLLTLNEKKHEQSNQLSWLSVKCATTGHTIP